MATTPELYTGAYVAIDGALLSQHAKVSVKRSNNSQRQDTVLKGYAGESPGSPATEITVDSAVPAADFEVDPGKFMKLNRMCEVSVTAAGKTLRVTGSITEDNFSHGVNDAAGLSFSFRGGWADWE